jgi:hypothetical protein
MSSLGFQSYRSDVYRQIATGSTSIGNVDSLYILTILYAAIWVIVLGRNFMDFVAIRRKNRTLLERIENLKAGRPEPIPTLDEIEGDVLRLRRSIKFQGWWVYGSTFTTTLLIAMSLVNFSRISYVNSASVHYQQVLRIASPFLGEAAHREVESRFAQIQTKQDYVAILDELTKTAKEHGQRVPDFRAW